ncbi:MAG: glycosyltransferase [Methanospirillum sp.]
MSRLIALPCRDAELVIGSLIMRARQIADAVLVIDEGSTDRTAEVAARAGATLLRRTASDGEGAGLREAVAYAARDGTTLLAVLFDDQLCRQECITRLTEPVRDGSADLVIGENAEGLTGLVVLNDHAANLAAACGASLTGPGALIAAAEAGGLRIRTLRIPEETDARIAGPATIGMGLRGIVTFTKPRAASAAYGSIFISLGIVAAAWSLSSFNTTALLYVEALGIGTVLAIAGLLLLSSPLLSDALTLVRKRGTE